VQVVERHGLNSPACAPVERHVLQRGWKLLGAISAIMERGAACERSEGAAAPSASTWNWSWTTRQSPLECCAQALVHAGIRLGWEGVRQAAGEGGRGSDFVVAKFKSHRAKNPHSRRPHALIVVTQLLQRSNQVLPVPTTSHSASKLKPNFVLTLRVQGQRPLPQKQRTFHRRTPSTELHPSARAAQRTESRSRCLPSPKSNRSLRETCQLRQRGRCRCTASRRFRSTARGHAAPAVLFHAQCGEEGWGGVGEAGKQMVWKTV
jgi:hypothetical protein